MATVEKFEDLTVWQLARELCKDIFRLTQEPPFASDFRFKDQIRASSGSVMDNIAEGFERSGNKEFQQFLYIAKGSCGEVRSQLHRASDWAYISSAEYEQLLQRSKHIAVTIQNLINHLKRSEMKGPKYKT